MVLYTDINLWIGLSMAAFGIGFSDLLVPGSGIVGSLLGGLFNRESQESKDAKKAQARLANAQAKLARGRGTRETQFFNQAQPIIGTVGSQLQALLTGDREALTQRFAPQLQQLTGAREAAQRRIQQSGPASGATAQASIELEKGAFAERNKLLAAAPAEAQAGLTQLLQLLLGAGATAGQGATSAANVAGAANQGVIQGDALSRAAGQGFFDSLLSSAQTFGGALFKPKQPFVAPPAGGLPGPEAFGPKAAGARFNPTKTNLEGLLG